MREKQILYNPISSEYMFPSGAVSEGELVEFRLKIRRDTFAYSVLLVLHRDEYGKDSAGRSHAFNVMNATAKEGYRTVKMSWRDLEADYNVYSANVQFETSGLYYYHFEVDFFGEYVCVGKESLGVLPTALTKEQHPEEWQVLVSKSGFKTPDWFKGGVMYHVFVDRFNRGTGKKAIKCRENIKKTAVFREKWGDAPYYKTINGEVLNNDFFGGNLYGIIEKLDYLSGLGVTVIYLSPIFEASSNHKYDTADYMKVDGAFGGDEAFCELCKKAAEKGMRVILDGVFNHTGDDSVYFNKYGRYNTVGAYQSESSPYYDWYSFQCYPDEYSAWWGIKTLPEVSKKESGFCDFITGKDGVIAKWVRLGASGFRLDVVDELPDKFVQNINKILKSETKDGLLIGEVWEDASNKISYGKRRKYFNGEELDSCMNYVLKDAIIRFVKYADSQYLGHACDELLNNYPKQVRDCLMNIIGTHDTCRALTVFAVDNVPDGKDDRAEFIYTAPMLERGIKYLKLASLLQFTFFGVPCIYYGDEVGMTGFEDPFCRCCFPWDGINDDLLFWYKRLSLLRRENSCFISGDFSRLVTTDDGVFAFARTNADCSVTVVVNRSGKPFVFELPSDGRYFDYFSGNAVCDVIAVEADGYAVLVHNRKSV